MTSFAFGPAGWSYPDWLGTVYPQPLPKGFNHLKFLANRFEFIEVNTTFYRIPAEPLIRGWLKKTADLPGFTFWVKLNQSFTHDRVLNPQLISEFCRAINPLAEHGRFAGLLAQFPYSFHHTFENNRHLEELAARIPREWPLAVEFRHRSWDCPPVLDRFTDRKWIWVNIDQPAISNSLPLTAHRTHPEIAYFRLHGRNAAAWFSGEGRDARYNYLYPASELGQIAAVVRRLQEEARRIFVSGNNHYKGSAVQNLIELKRMLVPEAP